MVTSPENSVLSAGEGWTPAPRRLTSEGGQHALQVGMPHCGCGRLKAESFLEPVGELPGHFCGEPVTPESQDRHGMYQGAFVN